MGLLSNPKFIWILLLLISIPLISAQEAGDETQIVESGGRFKDLGRRSKVSILSSFAVCYMFEVVKICRINFVSFQGSKQYLGGTETIFTIEL
ncbi:hypothetical protein MTR67_046735 [Solanum verrucosum]|uniref:Uncharacterized protein n=1 Tax=Solanum verrucosum TaxID=315347 RepID=A0AAF0UV55_SOLVR|nr:hypothetical protein MTR67_046735 [Solanum verrucosum]